MSDFLRPHEPHQAPEELTRLLCPWDFSGKNTGLGVISFSRESPQPGLEPKPPVTPALQVDSLLAKPLGKSLANGIEVYKNLIQVMTLGTSLAGQWLRIHTFTARGMGWIPGWGPKTPQATRLSQKIIY